MLFREQMNSVLVGDFLEYLKVSGTKNNWKIKTNYKTCFRQRPSLVPIHNSTPFSQWHTGTSTPTPCISLQEYILSSYGALATVSVFSVFFIYFRWSFPCLYTFFNNSKHGLHSSVATSMHISSGHGTPHFPLGSRSFLHRRQLPGPLA